MSLHSSIPGSSSLKHVFPDTSLFSWEELEKLFTATLNHSGIVINDVVLNTKSPDEDGLDRSIVAREITKTLKSIFELKKTNRSVI